ncbi:amino acid ABC transporter permease (plasmid) [Lichenicola cladoniae]|uniref:Amino acid ABC transporter permease n=1 Tax=Lichenicola cladoniae TaxID=1484109 RepID=A0A6M8HXI2_9PROT|nr:amino acid ABC transporter permease [Lichenicola cladoniae]NPD68668.1 amino acid ABC transporter permease [Acetobacteraceae bacterium]QKE93050.1 amino acid ABC transporter permease [Lichenicola cladoniae]
MSFDASIIVQHMPELLRATWRTLLLSVATAIITTPIALCLALARQTAGRVLAGAATIYVTTFRIIPVLIVLYFSFYGLPSLGLSLAPVPAALIGLVIASSAYMCEDVRGALVAVPSGQWQAARALGLSYRQIVCRIVVPQAIPRMLPPYMSRLIVIVKSTALAGIVSVNELTGTSYDLISSTYHATEFLAASACLYLAINGLLAIVQVWLERRFR